MTGFIFSEGEAIVPQIYPLMVRFIGARRLYCEAFIIMPE
jgi:hypothetical protein